MSWTKRIEAAFRENAVVRHITPPSRLDHYGKIGALLRYKIQDFPSPPAKGMCVSRTLPI